MSGGGDRLQSWFARHIGGIVASVIAIVVGGVALALLGVNSSNDSNRDETYAPTTSRQPAPSNPTPPPSSTTEPEPPPEPVACLPNPSTSDAGDGSLETAQGPLISGRVYHGTLIAGDQDWRGFCLSTDGATTIRFGNPCSESNGFGDTNLLASITDDTGEERDSLRPDPGKNSTYSFQAKAPGPYYVKVFDLDDIDLGHGNPCPDGMWTLQVNGPLTDQIADG